MEYWNDGILVDYSTGALLPTHYSRIPSFQFKILLGFILRLKRGFGDLPVGIFE